MADVNEPSGTDLMVTPGALANKMVWGIPNWVSFKPHSWTLVRTKSVESNSNWFKGKSLQLLWLELGVLNHISSGILEPGSYYAHLLALSLLREASLGGQFLLCTSL